MNPETQQLLPSTWEIRVGNKTIYGHEVTIGGPVRLYTDCDVHQGHLVMLEVTKEQADELALPRDQRRAVQEILPNVDARLREVFSTGITPAEWDYNLRGRAKAPARYPGYVRCSDE